MNAERNTVKVPATPDDQRRSKQKTVRGFNLKLALGTVIAMAILGPAIYAWHSYQVRRLAHVFLERADELEADQSPIAAAQYLHQYLQLNPKDNEVQVRMVRLVDQGAKGWGEKSLAVNLYYEAIGQTSPEEQSGLRRRLAELLLELKRFSAAKSQASQLLAADDTDPQGRRLLAMAIYGEVQSGAAAKSSQGPTINAAFDAALETNPGNIQLSTTLAKIYRNEEQLLDEDNRSLSQAERDAKADTLMDQMVQANATSSDAYLARYAYRTLFRLPGADEDLQSSLKYGQDDVKVLLTAASHARRNSRSDPDDAGKPASLAEARKWCERILQIAPGEERAYVLLGEILWDSGEREQAVETWRRGLKELRNESASLLFSLADALMTLRQVNEATTTLNSLDQLISSRAQVLSQAGRMMLECRRDFLRAKWRLLKGDYAGAIPLLKQVVAQEPSPDNAKQVFEAWSILAQIWSAEGDWDQAATAFEQASMLRPQLAALRLKAAKAWANAGRYDAAIRLGEQVFTSDNSTETLLFLADTYYRQQVSLPKKQRDWSAFQKRFADVVAATEKQTLADAWRVNLLQAQVLLAGLPGKSPDEAKSEAAQLLRTVEKECPDSAALMQALPLVFEQSGCAEDADRALKKLESLPGKQYEAMLCRFRLCMQRKDYAKAREVLQAGLEAAPNQRLPIRLAMASVSTAEGHQEQAFQELLQIAAQYPEHVLVLRRLLDMAVELGKTDVAEAWEEKLRNREGTNGYTWRYYRARRLLAKPRDVTDPLFLEAEKLVSELHSLRPTWPYSHLLLAIVAQKRGKVDQAIDAYEEAIRLGDRRIRVYEQLVELLYKERRFSEAEDFLSRLEEQVPLSDNLSTVEIALAAQAGQFDRALTMARRRVEASPDDPAPQTWLGQVLLMAGQNEEAERVLQGAVKLAPKDVRTYHALLTFYLRTHRPEMAAQTLESLEKNVTLSDWERPFVLAQGHEQIAVAAPGGEKYFKMAEEEYREAERLAPDRPAVLERHAAFLVRRDPATAEKSLRRVLELNPNSTTARGLLAQLLAERGGAKEWQESQRLVSTPEGQAASSSQRLQATLLVRRGGKDNLAKARELLESITSDSKTSTPDDHLLLANLYENEGRIDLARQQYAAVINQSNIGLERMIGYVDFLLRQKADKEASPYIEKLRKQHPEDIGVAGAWARWLAAQQRDSEIETEIEAIAEKALQRLPKDPPERTTQEAQLARRVGAIFSAVKQYPAAERWYRRLVALAPQQYPLLAMCLGQQHQFSAVVIVCTEAAKTDNSAQPAVVLCSVFAANRAGPADIELAAPLITQTQASHPNDLNLLNSVANLRVMQGRLDDAIASYRQALSIDSKNVVTLNNLATLLAEQPEGRQEAIRLIDQAIDAAGRLPGLLDTKGTILVFDNKPQEAVPLLQEAASGSSVDPRILFHLGLAYDGINQPDDAKVSLQKARDGNLAGQILTASERRMLEQLEKKTGL